MTTFVKTQSTTVHEFKRQNVVVVECVAYATMTITHYTKALRNWNVNRLQLTCMLLSYSKFQDRSNKLLYNTWPDNLGRFGVTH